MIITIPAKTISVTIPAYTVTIPDPVPTPVPTPTPTPAPTGVLPVYQNGVFSWGGDYSWGVTINYSDTVGKPGARKESCGVPMASARILPPLICGLAEGRSANISCIWPPIRSVMAGPLPL